jgi:hypothetical protein
MSGARQANEGVDGARHLDAGGGLRPPRPLLSSLDGSAAVVLFLPASGDAWRGGAVTATGSAGSLGQDARALSGSFGAGGSVARRRGRRSSNAKSSSGPQPVAIRANPARRPPVRPHARPPSTPVTDEITAASNRPATPAARLSRRLAELERAGTTSAPS